MSMLCSYDVCMPLSSLVFFFLVIDKGELSWQLFVSVFSTLNSLDKTTVEYFYKYTTTVEFLCEYFYMYYKYFLYVIERVKDYFALYI